MTPLVMICGFLGVGKTTLLRELISNLSEAGCLPHVILNDYRNAAVDGVQLAESKVPLTLISGTCVCCGSRDELIETLSHFTLGERSVVLLEVNGTADSAELIELLSADRRLANYSLPVQVAVVNTRRWQKRLKNRLERSQVQTARWVKMTHLEDVKPWRVDQVGKALGELVPRSEITTSSKPIVEAIVELVDHASEIPARRFESPVSAVDVHDHHHEHHFSSMEVRFPDRVDRAAFLEFLNRLSPNVLRAKGIVKLSGEENRTYYFERLDTPDSVNIRTIEAPWPLEPTAILIGVGIDKRSVLTLLSRLDILTAAVPEDSGGHAAKHESAVYQACGLLRMSRDCGREVMR